MKLILRELRLAARSLRRDPTFSVAAILTLALGIGATTAVFSVLYGVLLSPLPYPGAERIVRLHSTNPAQSIVRGQMSPSDMWDFREESRSIEAAAPYFPYEGTLIDETGNPVRIPAYVTSSDFFRVFPVAMTLGRGFLPEEDQPDTELEVVLAHSVWQNAFGGDPEIVGRSITAEGNSVLVVGVAPPTMRYPRDAAMWILPGIDWPNFARRARNWEVVARMTPGTAVATAQAELSTIASRLEEEHARWNRGVGVEVVPLKESIVGDLGTPLLILMAAAAGLLAVAAANVANLLLARGAARLSETALRSALGASRWRIMGGLLAEAFVLSAAGALAGIGIAFGAIQLFRGMAPPSVSLLGDVAFGWEPLLFAAAITVGSTLLFGLMPAIKAAAVDIRSLLGEGGRGGSAGAAGNALRSALVVAEVGVATALVIGSGLLIRSFQNIQSVDPGFGLREAVTFNVSPPIGLYEDLADVNLYYDRLLVEMSGIPGVSGVTTMGTLPLSSELDLLRPVRIMDLPDQVEGEEPQTYMRPVGSTFFEVMGVAIVEGRGFTSLDTRESTGVAVVNETFVRRHIPEEVGGRRALGRRVDLISRGFGPIGQIYPEEVEIVGVVGDVRYAGLTQEPEPAIYLPRQQASFRRQTVVLATTSDLGGIATALHERAYSTDAQVAISGLATMEGVIAASTVSQRFIATLLMAFGIVALVVAAMGIYGVVAYQVTERIREMAVRMSLGATPGEVIKLILKSGGRMWGAGIVAGLGGALVLRQVVASQLYGISATDPTIFLGAALFLGMVSLAATWVPAYQATRIEPAGVLREG